MFNNIFILFLVLILVVIIYTTKENFEGISKPKKQCIHSINASLYPKDENELYNSSMLYKYYKNGLNSNMFTVNYDFEDIILNQKLKNLPNEENDIGAINEGTSQLKFCKPCVNIKSEDACKKNLRITGDDYCPNLSECSTAQIMPNSITLKHPENLQDKDKLTYLKKMEIISELRQGYNKFLEKRCIDYKKKINEYPEIKTSFSNFHNIYSKLLNYSYKIDKFNNEVDFSDINNFDIVKLTNFLNDPKNIFLFNLKSNISIKVFNKDGTQKDYISIQKAKEDLSITEKDIYDAIRNFKNIVSLKNKKILAGRNELDTTDYLTESLNIMNDYAKNIKFCIKY